MCSTENSGLGHGSAGSPQTDIQEQEYPVQQNINERVSKYEAPPKYKPSPKHQSPHNWGSTDPIRTSEEGQRLLESGFPDGRQFYNITDEGVIVKFQPDNTPENGYHAYAVTTPRDIPNSVLKKMKEKGLITSSDYNKLRKGKK